MNDNDGRPTGEDLATRRRRLRFRCWHRGTREMDLLLGSFADRHIDAMDTAALDAFERLLGENDPDLYGWIVGQSAPPEALDGPLLRQLMAHRYPVDGER